jgi:hypothetical protein
MMILAQDRTVEIYTADRGVAASTRGQPSQRTYSVRRRLDRTDNESDIIDSNPRFPVAMSYDVDRMCVSGRGGSVASRVLGSSLGEFLIGPLL